MPFDVPYDEAIAVLKAQRAHSGELARTERHTARRVDAAWGWASYAMVLRYARLAPSHLATYAGNSSATGHKTGHTEEFPGRGRRATPKNGRPCRDRTYDQRIKSPLLYQLS